MAPIKPLPKCDNCGEEVPYAASNCVLCGHPVGYPNIRAADQEDEVLALRERLREAQVSTEARHCRTELEAFGTAAASSQPVVSRHLAVLMGMALNQNTMMSTYHKLVHADARLPEQNEHDPLRAVVEGLVNPHGVHEHITSGALTLDGLGVEWYGDYSINLKEEMIANRATVFEENPFTFCDKHGIAATKAVPAGYRASWSRRSELAMAKLHSEMKPGLSDSDFPGILLAQGAKAADTDFIEVQIYGPIHPRAISRVVARNVPKKGADAQIWKKVKQHLTSLGAVVEEV